MRLPKVAVIGTGGSISTPGVDSLDLFEYGDHHSPLEVDELLALVPEAAAVADVVPVRFRAIKSVDIRGDDLVELHGLVHRLARSADPPDGVVITHGTATLEETAYFLNLTLAVELPVVLVGAQRPPNGLGTDAGINLVNAIRTAGSAAARGLGVLVVMNDEVHGARDVTKTSNRQLHAFQSPGTGRLGTVDADGAVMIYHRPGRRHAPDTEFDLDRIAGGLPRVDISYSYIGCDGVAIRAFAAAGAAGIVNASLAPGRVSPAEDAAIAEAIRRGVTVVRSSRVQTGRILAGEAMDGEGLIAADDLNPQKARILTMLALAVTRDRAEIRRMFSRY